MTDIRVITFDLDNTLWDVDPILRRAEAVQRDWLLAHRPGAIEDYDHDALWEFKKQVFRDHPHLAHQISKFRIRTLYLLQRQAGYDEDASQQGAQSAFDAFLKVRQEVELYENALHVLEQLANRYTLGALTNGNADIYKTDAAEYFDFAFLAEELDASKPAPDMFHAALDRTGVTPAQVIHVGDNPEHDVRGAAAVGMYTVWVNASGDKWPGDDLPTAQIQSIEELPAAILAIEAGSPVPN